MPRVVEPDDEGLDAFMGADMDAVDTPQAPPADTEPPEDKAARTLYAALVADTGRPKGLPYWKPIVKEALGVKALWGRRWDEVMERGKALGLFEIDDSRKYPVLKALEQPEPEPESEPEPEPEPEPKPTPKPQEPKWKAPPIPEDWEPPEYLPCGHWNYQTYPVTEEDDKGKQVTRWEQVKVEKPGPEHCPACKAKKPGHPQHQEGEWRTPVIPAQRRTPEKEDMGGFPGYCVNEEGYYIGGLANNCLAYRPEGEEPCAVHRKSPLGKKAEGRIRKS